MEKKTYLHIPSTTNPNIHLKLSSIPFLISTTTALDHRRSNKSYFETIVVPQLTVNSTIKHGQFNRHSIRETFANTTLRTVISTPLYPRETLPMTNTSNHLMSTLNPAHLTDSSGSYFVSSLNDLTSNYKLNPSSNTDIPSPSSSSNSSNPPSSSHQHHHHPNSHHQTRRHGEGGDPTRKREMRLQKNREAARECRRKKKEYIKCLEERVAGLENQNKALIEELRQLKELYCQREDTNKKK